MNVVIKKALPFITEFVVFIMIAVFLLAYFFLSDTIRIKWTVSFVLLTISSILWLVTYVLTFVPRALAAIFDVITQNVVSNEFAFVEQFVSKSSILLDKNEISKGKDISTIEQLYYKVVLTNRKGEIVVLTSSSYIHFNPKGYYMIMYLAKSKIIIDVNECI